MIIKQNKLYILAAIIFFQILFSCDLFESTDPVDNSGAPTKEFATDQGGNLKTKDGAELIVPTGAISKNEEGENGKIIFSIEENVKPEEYPAEIPANFNLISNVFHFGPSHFSFQYPLRVFIPATDLDNLEGVYFLWYSELDAKWVIIPISEVDAVNKRIGVSVFELGYFALVQEKQVVGVPPGGEILEFHRSGGARLQNTDGLYYYSFIVAGFVPKYPEDATFSYHNFIASTSPAQGGIGPKSTTYLAGLKPGTYTFVASRQKQASLFSPPGNTEYYTIPCQVNVASFGKTVSWNLNENSVWSEIEFSGGTWQPGYPTVWPVSNKPLGTGELQITLSWTNIQTRIYTVDLYLVGPNNLIVSWKKSLSDDGSLALDRTSVDNKVGYSVRNIYSKKSMASGTYKVYVNIYDKHTGDDPMPFEVRVIRNSKFVKLIRNSIIKLNNSDDISQMLLVYEFTI
jgi:hypothetical protein